MKSCFQCKNIVQEDEVIHFAYYFQNSDWEVCKTCFHEICIEVIEHLNSFYPKMKEKYPHWDERKLFERQLNDQIYTKFRDQIRKAEYSKARSDLSKHLIKYLSKSEIKRLKSEATCALTGVSENLTLDHFIPLNWGHGGTYHGNIYFVTRKLNGSKRNENPFEWIRFASDRYEEIDLKLWRKLVEKLATLNKLSIPEFKDYVYWCEENKRTSQELAIDNSFSLDLWRNTRGLKH